jgi:hypothetical protein
VSPCLRFGRPSGFDSAAGFDNRGRPFRDLKHAGPESGSRQTKRVSRGCPGFSSPQSYLVSVLHHMAEGNTTMKRLIIGLTIFMTSSAASKVSHAGLILVSYTVSGSPGDYDLDFRVTNSMTAWHQDIYLFGLSLSGFDVADSPPPFGSLGATSLNFAFYGGSNNLYNTNWRVDPPLTGLLPGNTLSGFIAHDTDLVAPTAVSWFVFSQTEVGFETEPYTGGGSFNSAFSTTNPGFEGTANPAVAVPEPSGFVLTSILLCMLAIGWVRQRLRRAVTGAAFQPCRL